MSPNRKRSRSFGATVPAYGQCPDAMTLFRARLHAGDYEALVGRKLRLALREAAADPSVDFEIGALRLALSRLINEETDPSRLAASVARIGAVAVQISRLRHNSQNGRSETHAKLVRVLAEIDAEADAARAALTEAEPTQTPPAIAPLSYPPCDNESIW